VLPFATHTLTVARTAEGGPALPNVDPWDDAPVTGQPRVVHQGVPAVLLDPSVTVTNDGGQRTVTVTPIRLQPDADVQPGDVVTVEGVDPAEVHTVQWIKPRRGGDGAVDHLVGELQAISGEV
jgi:hypothetical protein